MRKNNLAETYEEICEFVTEKPGRTINEVVKHIWEIKHLCSKQPAENRVRDLLGNRLTDDRGPGPKGFHHLYINDKNKYVKLSREINLTSSRLKATIRLFQDNKGMFKSSSKFTGPLHIRQLILYNKISKIAHEIKENIKRIEDREVLYARLMALILDSSVLNETAIPPILLNITRLEKEVDTLKITKDKADLMRNMIDGMHEETVELMGDTFKYSRWQDS